LNDKTLRYVKKDTKQTPLTCSSGYGKSWQPLVTIANQHKRLLSALAHKTKTRIQQNPGSFINS
jgi:hypothetical protein